MCSDEIEENARDIPGFIGVFALDRIPSHISHPSCFIVNNHTQNLEGEHWLAVRYEKCGEIYVFDSFGYYYPKMLIERLCRLPFKRLILNRIVYQMPWETTCSEHCFAFLRRRTINRKMG